MVENKAPVVRLIAGTPRSATTFLARAMNVHPEIASFGETSFWGREYHQPGPDGAYTTYELKKVVAGLKKYELPVTIGKNKPGNLKKVTKDAIEDIVEHSFSEDKKKKFTPADVFCKFCDAISSAEGKRYWVEKTPHHVMWADRIFTAMPNTRLLIVLREPYGFMRSYKRKMEVNFEKGERLDIYHPLRCALVWRATARTTLRLIKRYPGKVLLIKTHEIHSNSKIILNRIVSFFDLPAINWNDVNLPSGSTNTFFAGGKKPKLPEIDKAWMNLIARKEIRNTQFDYIQSNVTSKAFAKSFFTLPIWLLQTYRNMSRIVPGSTIRYIGHWIAPSSLSRRIRKQS